MCCTLWSAARSGKTALQQTAAHVDTMATAPPEALHHMCSPTMLMDTWALTGQKSIKRAQAPDRAPSTFPGIQVSTLKQHHATRQYS